MCPLSYAEGDTLKQLYLSIIRPHLEYACPVWDPHTMKDKTLLENVQKFAFRMATKQWDSGYQDLLDIMNVPSLANCRLQLKLSQLPMVCAISPQTSFVLVVITVTELTTPL